MTPHEIVAAAVLLLIIAVGLAALRFLFPAAWDWILAVDDGQGDDPDPAAEADTVVLPPRGVRGDPDGAEFWRDSGFDGDWSAPREPARRPVSLTRRVHRRKTAGPAGVTAAVVYPELAAAVASPIAVLDRSDPPTPDCYPPVEADAFEPTEEWVARITGPGGVADTAWFDRAMAEFAPGQVGRIPQGTIRAGQKRRVTVRGWLP